MSDNAKKTFYARSANLIIYITPPKRLIQDGQATVIEGRKIAFTAMADNWGRYTTSDPDEIAYLENRAKTIGDIFTGEEYNRLTTPLDIQLNSAQRVIEEQNGVIRKLEEIIRQLETQKRQAVSK